MTLTYYHSNPAAAAASLKDIKGGCDDLYYNIVQVHYYI